MPKYYYPLTSKEPGTEITADVCVYGATPAGILAALQAARMGKSVVLTEFGTHIGGMNTSGLSAVDVGDQEVAGGMAQAFYETVDQWYGRNTRWYFEPHVAMEIYQRWLANSSVRIYTLQRLAQVEKDNDQRITRIVMENGNAFRAKVYIDAGYEGDLLARAGVRYAVGREGDRAYDEHFNGVHYGSPNHNFMRFVDPYRKLGDPSSGLLPGISIAAARPEGERDTMIQAFNFRLCLTQKTSNLAPFPKPPEYDPERYELLRRYIDAGVFDIFRLTIAIPNDKADNNNWGGFNSDNIGASWGWPEGDYAQREAIYQDHVNYQQGLMWFLANDPRLPRIVRETTSSWGLAADEFTATGNWPPQLYVRESRRMISDYVVTEHDAYGVTVVDDSIGMASYKMDSHNCERIVKNRRASNEGNFEVAPIAPYAVPYRAIRPQKAECQNLLVPVCASASHVGFGSIRTETTYMILGQSAGIAAALAAEGNRSVQDLSYPELEKELHRAGQILKISKGLQMPALPKTRRAAGVVPGT